MFPASKTVINTRCISAFLVSIVGVSSLGASASLVFGMGICVDLAFFRVWFKCTWGVATDFGIYLCTGLDFNNGQDWKKPLSTAYIHVYVTKMNIAACGYCISSVIDDVLLKKISVIIVVDMANHWAG